MKIEDLEVAFRAPREDDLPFIFDTWVESFRLSHAAGPIPMDMYRNIYREVIRRLMQFPDVEAIVAYNAEIHKQVLGYIVFGGWAPKTVHFLFVKHWFRHNGLARELMHQAGLNRKQTFAYSFKSRIASELTRSWSGAKFDPITIRKQLSISKEEA